MNASTLIGHAAFAGLATTVWEVGVHLPAGDPGILLVAAGLAPFAVAAVSLALVADADRRIQRPALPEQRRQPSTPTRKELTR